MIDTFLGKSLPHLFPGKLRSCWTGLYIILHVFPYGAVEIQDPDTGGKFKVNGKD